MTYQADVSTITPLIKALLLTDSDIKDAYGDVPFTVTACPVAIVIPEGSSEDWSAGGDELAAEGYETRIYRILMLVAPSGGGVSGEIIARVHPFYDKMHHLFVAHPSMGSPFSGVFNSEYLGDAGLQTDMLVGGIKYAGTICRVKIVARLRVPYAQGE